MSKETKKNSEKVKVLLKFWSSDFSSEYLHHHSIHVMGRGEGAMGKRFYGAVSMLSADGVD